MHGYDVHEDFYLNFENHDLPPPPGVSGLGPRVGPVWLSIENV